MIYNQHLDRLMGIDIIQDFMRNHNMQGKMCSKGDSHSLILYQLPYVIEFYDALIENYLEIYLSDLNSGLLMDGSSVLGCSLDLGLQSLAQLQHRNLSSSPAQQLFLSENNSKTRDLYSNIGAINKILPLISIKGGLTSIKNGTFDSRFDFRDSIKPMWHGLKEKYISCINSNN